jgi:hypothetical protein
MNEEALVELSKPIENPEDVKEESNFASQASKHDNRSPSPRIQF